MRRFILQRDVDISGISGVGTVAEGVQFSDGFIAMRWPSSTPSTVVYNSLSDLMKVHLHSGLTALLWVDAEIH